jgi:hypothetical protein
VSPLVRVLLIIEFREIVFYRSAMERVIFIKTLEKDG